MFFLVCHIWKCLVTRVTINTEIFLPARIDIFCRCLSGYKHGGTGLCGSRNVVTQYNGNNNIPLSHYHVERFVVSLIFLCSFVSAPMNVYYIIYIVTLGSWFPLYCCRILFCLFQIFPDFDLMKFSYYNGSGTLDIIYSLSHNSLGGLTVSTNHIIN